ncbi:hypothetical protein Tco_0597884 [Tanacetum coccineum]
MAALPICDELRISVNTADWEPQFILRCHREISQDLRLAREINTLCVRLTAVVDEREAFADELDMLARKYVLESMEDCKKRDLFVGFYFVGPPSSVILIGSTAVVGLTGGVTIFQEEEDAVC